MAARSQERAPSRKLLIASDSISFLDLSQSGIVKRTANLHAEIVHGDSTLLQASRVDVKLQREPILAVVRRVRFRGMLEDYFYVTDAGILLQVLNDNAIEARSDTVDIIRRRFHCCLEEYIAKNESFVELLGARRFSERLKKPRLA